LWAGNYVAASCNWGDVNAVINGPTHNALPGDTILIPAGSCTWTNVLSIPVGLTLTGSGTPNTGPLTFGAGNPTTIITDNVTGGKSTALIYSSGLTYGQTLVIQLLDIEANSGSTVTGPPIQVSGTCSSSGCGNFRADNIVFGKTVPFVEATNGLITLIGVDNIYGVADHNTALTGNTEFININFTQWLGVGSYGDNSWAQPDSFGTAANFFVENNNLGVSLLALTEDEYPVPGSGGGSEGGSRQVDRFNRVTASGATNLFAVHGLDTGGRSRNGRSMEIYGNAFTCVNSGCQGSFYRAGTGIHFGNTFSLGSGGYWNDALYTATYRTQFGAMTWGFCGGDPGGNGAVWDINDTSTTFPSGSGVTVAASGNNWIITDSSKNWTPGQWTGYSFQDTTQSFYSMIANNGTNTLTILGAISEEPWTPHSGDSYQMRHPIACADQGGRGQSVYISGANPTPVSLNNALDPIYEWNDQLTGQNGFGVGKAIGSYPNIMANRDFYTDGANGGPQIQTSSTSPFNGTSGVGFGTLANRPTTCTPGPNGAPGVGYYATDQGNWNLSGNSFGQGELFVCTAANTWSLYYTPYTYPNPLTTGTGTGTGPTLPAPPTNLGAIVK
jgi:hypothetical protein